MPCCLGGTSWVVPASVIQMLLSWQGAPLGKKRKKIWIAAPICLFWTVWHNRNMLVFENRVTSGQRTKFLFLSKLWTLANTHSVEKMYSLVDFLTWLGSGNLFFQVFLSLLWTVGPLGRSFVLRLLC